MEVTVDLRRLVIGSAVEAEAIAEREIAWMREHEVVLARALERIERERSYVRHGCSSAVHWAVERKLDRRRALELVRLGRLIAHVPHAAVEVESGEVTPQTAAVAGRLVPSTPTTPPKVPEDPVAQEQRLREAAARAAAMLERSKTVSASQFRSEVATELEEVAQGARVVRLAFDVKERVRVAWRRARTLASRRAGRFLTEGESFEAVTGDYLDRHDLLCKRPRERRVGPTSARPGDRYVPTDVRREVAVRTDDHCEVPGCGNGVFLQNAHGVPHSRGGDREAPNLRRLCTVHHAQQEAGLIRLIERTLAGATYLVVATGELLVPDPRSSAAEPLPERSKASGGSEETAQARPAPGDRVGEAPPPEWGQCTARRDRPRRPHSPHRRRRRAPT